MCYLILPSFIHNNILKLVKIGYHVIVLKHSKADSDSFSSVLRRSFKLLQITAIVLSSEAKMTEAKMAVHIVFLKCARQLLLMTIFPT